MSTQNVVAELLKSIGVNPDHPFGDDVARIQVHQNHVVGIHLIPGLKVEADETKDGIAAHLLVEEGAVLKKPVHICFGVLPEEGLQHIQLNIDIRQDSKASILAHCTFPNAKQVEHVMDAQITVGPRAHYAYFERHVHGPYGGVQVIPNAKIVVHEGAEFSTEFELIKGRAGTIKFDYEAECRARSILEMTARINGRENDIIVIQETAHLIGEAARGALTSHIALRDSARAEVFNTLTANAPRARGHVDCKEIVVGQAVAKAVPIVEVMHPTAHVTHEAAIGSVDSKQLQTLLARGLDEEEATDLIIEGLLSKKTAFSSTLPLS
ncbi:MAG TPA: SufD family Fe-S cluster assembly protein [Candidatus Hydrogenedentes bacterium]|nr:SufD family Fe-S cluster assembly protein [Candidatus Hydrogenedentota bacterium]